MSLGLAFLLGLIQGLTEFLPISSSGHLIVLPYLLGLDDFPHPLLFDVLLHGATLLAVALYFRRELKGLLKSLRRAPLNPEEDALEGQGRKILLLIPITLLPLPLVALGLGDWLEGMSQSPQWVGVFLGATGGLCWSVDAWAPRASKSWRAMGPWDALWVGLAQAMAALQGISRSGATIAAGLWRGLERDVAARFSFLISLPAIAGAILWEARHLESLSSLPWSACLLGMGTAFLSGYAALTLLFRVLRQGRFRLFAYYCWALGCLTLLRGWLG